MRKNIVAGTLLVSLLGASEVMADVVYDGTSVGGQVGIFGLGATLKGKFTDNVGIRVGFDKFTYNDYEVVDDQVKYNFDVETNDFLATLDWHPFGSSFKTSGGVVVNNSTLVGTITPTQSQKFVFNDIEYSTDDIAKVHTNAEFDPVAPYVGIGWDTSWEKKNGFGFTFDLGVIYQGSVKVDYDVKYQDVVHTDNAIQNQIADQARATLISEIDQNLAEEKKSLQTELDKYEFLPYIAIGVNYKF